VGKWNGCYWHDDRNDGDVGSSEYVGPTYKNKLSPPERRTFDLITGAPLKFNPSNGDLESVDAVVEDNSAIPSPSRSYREDRLPVIRIGRYKGPELLVQPSSFEDESQEESGSPYRNNANRP
jgi:hypothetical protein